MSFSFFQGCFLFLGLSVGVEIHTLDGTMHSGKWVDISPEHRMRIEDKSGDLKEIDIKEIYFLAQDPRKEMPAPRLPAGLILVDRTILAGEIQGGDEESLFIIHPDLGRLAVPIDFIATLALDQPALPQDFDAYRSLEEDDILYKRGERKRGRDYIRGTLIAFKSKGITFDCSLGSLEFAYQELEALTLANLPVELPGEDFRVLVALRNGAGMIRGLLKGATTEEVMIKTIFSDAFALPKAAVGSIAFEGKELTYLSDLEPAQVEQIPYLGEMELFLYPFRQDRSVTGRWLSGQGRIFSKGLGVHAKTVLSYDLDEKYRAFEAFLGICDEVQTLPARGSVQFRVSLEGEQVYESPILRGGDGPLKMPRLDLAGASSLTLVVDFADGFDSGDRALIGMPVLVPAAE
ncbi:MAG: NPCBM/NEW2 domain-containing protein [Planctomycetota bacterium]